MHAGLYFALSVFAHSPGGSESPAPLAAGGYCESDSVEEHRRRKKIHIILNLINDQFNKKG